MSINEILPPGSKCLPGETVVELKGDVTVVGGRGLQVIETASSSSSASTTKLVATVAGIVKKGITELSTSTEGNDTHTSSSSSSSTSIIQYEVVSPTMRKYFPEVGDFVIGIIVRQVGGTNGNYQVHIASAHLATLEPTAFDGASKHSKPRLLPGDLVYAHVVRAEPDLDIILTCCSLPHMERKDWVTGEGTFGPLSGNGSAMVRISLQYAKDLISASSSSSSPSVLAMLGKRTSFEAAVGMNGIIWVSNLTAFIKNSISAKNNQQQNQPTSQSAKAAAAVSSLTPDEVRKQVFALVALCQCVVGAENDTNSQETQERVDRYFPTTMMM